jgi:hypothetical protein
MNLLAIFSPAGMVHSVRVRARRRGAIGVAIVVIVAVLFK